MPNQEEFDISNYIINEYFFHRLQDFCECKNDEVCFCSIDYDEFLEWNINCFEEFDNEKKLWIENLCNDIKLQKVNIMDEEDCVNFTSKKIFFDLNKSLVITCPR